MRNVVEAALGVLLPPHALSELKQDLFSCLDSLPDDGRVAHIGVMLARRVRATRLCVSVSPESVPGYLARIGWSGPTDRVRSMLSDFAWLAGSVRLNFDVPACVCADAGIEFILHGLPGEDPRISRFLERLVEQSLCTREKERALRSWSGFSYEISSPLYRPNVLSRRLSHVKIICRNDGPPVAKAYLWFGRRPYTFST